MSELRQDLATGDWVIIAPERLKGKSLQSKTNPPVTDRPAFEPSCPFCPANEERFPHVEVDCIAHPDAEAGSRWLVWGIENKYKIFKHHDSGPEGLAAFERDGPYARVIGQGVHELVIESPLHNRTFATMSPGEVEAVVAMYLRRFRALKQIPGSLLTIMFKNHGPRSGASQPHSHSQILSCRVVPNHLRYMLEEGTRYFDTNGVCVFCRMIEFELSDGSRVVYQNERFVAYAPFAQPTPYEVHIFPKGHDSLFEDMSDEEAADFADCLRATMKKLYVALSNPDFNLILRNPPHHLARVPFYHWHLRVVPHLCGAGGFERGSRMTVNLVVPEDTARELREATAD
ncbi:MAG: hypothetical protein DRI90_25280, partial [Deltaproteobacteria bacterium]